MSRSPFEPHLGVLQTMAFRFCLVVFCLVNLSSWLSAAPPATRPVEGLRNSTPAFFALSGARIVVAPGRTVHHGVIVIRDGIITDVRTGSEVPPDARVIDLSGKTVYAGFLDAYGETSITGSDGLGTAPYWNSQVTPERNVADQYEPSSSLNGKLRSQGITARLVAPSGGIIKGRSAVALTGDQDSHHAIVNPDVGLHVRLTLSRRRGRGYPNSPMGAVALARQAMLDADWYARAWSAHRASPTLPRPERNDALDALQGYFHGNSLVIADATNELFFLRADRFAREFGLNLLVRGSGYEYRRLDAIRKTGRAVVIPVNFPKPPNVATAESTMGVSLESLLHWDIAPENPARLESAGIKFAFTTAGLDDEAQFLKQIRLAVERGLGESTALSALTTTPAELLGVTDRLGSVEIGKLANLVVTDGDLFRKQTKVIETWVHGERHELVTAPQIDARGSWQVRGDSLPGSLELIVSGSARKLSGKLTVQGESSEADEKEVKLSRTALRDSRLSALFNSKLLGHDGVAQLTAVLASKGDKPQEFWGQIVWPDGSQTQISGQRTVAADALPQIAEMPNIGANLPGKDAASPSDRKRASFEVNYPLGAFGRSSSPPQQTVLFRNATIWTCSEQGVLENASVLIQDGRVVAVGSDLQAPENAEVIDASGKHITPGIIDCHSHMATDGGVNESGQAITAEVRIGDFIDADDINIYRQLAGGVTSSNILHGSANPIGGQNQVIKLRWGDLPEQLKFAEAPGGIKFALGENVKRSNWTEPSSRYPGSRMGVEQIIRDAFYAAQDYLDQWDRWKNSHAGPPPRRDLELEALAEVVSGTRWVHCHSYRQDEILALIRTLDGFGIQIGTFQHILEGYKVADEMAKHGAMGSAFSDWWAYKLEVYDAIPYAGALMHEAGVVVSFNSDDRELARHLNHEAAKAVKYGGVPAEEALKFVTLNPAKQLRIDEYVGSLEAGKHADLVIWSGAPLSIFSRCEQTWIDGRRYFDIAEDQALRQEATLQRRALVQKILSSGQKMREAGSAKTPEEELWPREDIFCRCRVEK